MTYSLFDSYRSLKVPVKSVMDDLVMLRKLCNTFSPRVFYKKHLRNQSIGKTLFQVFAGNSLEFKYTKWCSALPVAAASLCPYTALPHGMTSVRR